MSPQTALNTLFLILQFLFLDLSVSTDIIASTQLVKDPQALISSGSIFKFGFFTLPNTTNRYVGVLYNISVITPIWVANRNNHLNDAEGSFTISDNGNLEILDGQNQSIWSSTISNPSNSTTFAQILDTGNLVLRDNSSGNILWESFKNPTDSSLQNMKIGEGNNWLTSWTSPFDPSVGTFSAGVDASNIPQVVIWNNSQRSWRSGPWNGQTFIGLPNMDSSYLDGFSMVDNNQYLTFAYADTSMTRYFRLNYDGNLVQRLWQEDRKEWDIIAEVRLDECDIYGKCGIFGICQVWESQPVCSCLDGFELTNWTEWNAQNFTSGCRRRVPLKCQRNDSFVEGNEDGFLRFSTVKIPDLGMFYSNENEDNCENACLSNCSCVAYSYATGIGCMHWNSSLVDTRRFTGHGGVDLYLRVANSELGNKRNIKVVIVVAAVLASISFTISMYFFRRWMMKRKEMKQESELPLKRADFYQGYVSDQNKQVSIGELPLFTFNDLAIATENFHSANKLGEGGFGPVYKGKLKHGQEIAVKRLSRSSGQGIEEFMNEVIVISKLQHRNLVQLIGCCREKDEKILVYEYMSSGSLDAYLFDKVDQENDLDWPKRMNIIEGIERGLLYLHRDSRLKIIHRDLKPSNILLDKELNAKISDFGMARIFGGNQCQANTKRVVGTYGYMAPEYAIEGRFSEKTDVFSLGVLLLEIVSGRKNTSFYHDEFTSSLLGYTWKLWKEEKILELVDPNIFNPCFQTEILRYVHVGLLCVQEFAADRPNVSTVLSMLSSEIVDLPAPKQPAFAERLLVSEIEIPNQIQLNVSVNDTTLSVVQAR